jgi:hypothetical protein
MVSVRENHNASLICKAEGTPLPTITWRREDNQNIILKRKKKEGKKGTRLSPKLPGANPTTPDPNHKIANYNASDEIFYNATGCAFHKQKYFILLEKRFSLLQRGRCRCKFKCRRIGS